MTLTTHVLDTARGAPAAGVTIALYARAGDARRLLCRACTNGDGRTDAPLASEFAPGIYELVFDVADYFARSQTAAFYDEISVRISIADAGRSYHVPLLLSPWSYATYRGS